MNKKNKKIILAIFLFAIVSFSYCASGDKKINGTGNSIDSPAADNSQNNTNNKETFSGNSITDVEDPDIFIGEYNAYVSSFKAVIRIYTAKNNFFGTITFENWGKGQSQPLKDLNISNNKIYFVRSIDNADEMNEYNSSRLFRQQYHGVYSDDKKKIKGYYIEAGAEASWWAEKK